MRLRSELEKAGLHEALRDLDVARIGTIHAFAGTLLRERPVEAGVDPGFTVADPLTAGLLRDAAWDSWLEEAVATPEAAAPVRRAIELGLPLQTLRALAFALVEERDQLGALPAPAAGAESLAALSREARAAIAECETLAHDHVKDPSDRAAVAVLDLAAWARQTEGLPDAEQIAALLENAPFPDKVDRLGTQRKWREKGRLQECRDKLGALRDRVGAARAVERHNLAAALTRWASGFTAAYQARKVRAGCLDFQDLLLYARNLVRDHAAVRRDFQRRIRYLLVDEFQDTDPLQLEMILHLADGAPPGSLFIVGDPKQSIYRFRRADIETYEDAKATVAACGAVLTIRANFRSDQTLLDAVNQVFDGVMTPPDDGAYQPAYVPLEPGPETRPGAPPIVLQLPDDATPPRSVDEAREQEARLLAAYLRQQAEGDGGLRYGDVVLLFRAMTGVAAYEDAFREAGVPFRTVGGRHYYDRSEVGWVIAALTAVEDPHDPVALIGALRSPFLGLSDDALFRFHRLGGEFCYLRPLPPGTDPVIAEAWALLGELHRDRNTVAAPALVERLYARTQVLAAYALDSQGEARVANLLKVLDTARSLEATGVLTFRGLVRWLRERGAARYEEEESLVAEEEENVVRLMTIHKAKGLEFPVVIVPDLCRAAPLRPGIVLVDRRAGTLAVNLGMANEVPVCTLNWQDLEAREQRRADAESLRLLYVALTRAERGLVLPLPARPEPSGFFPYLDPIMSSPEAVSLAVTRGREARPGEGAGAPDEIESLAAWRSHRAALLQQATVAELRVRPSAADPVERIAVSRDGTRLGALVHAALAEIDLAHPDDAPALVAALGARHGVSAELISAATRLVRKAMGSPVAQRARRATWMAREVSVTAEIDGALVEGRVDLLFEEDGGLVAVEFKTDADATDAQEQAARYAGAVSRALGRPIREALVVRLVD